MHLISLIFCAHIWLHTCCEQFSLAKIIHPPDRCGISIRWYNSMITQVRLVLGTIKGHSKICSFVTKHHAKNISSFEGECNWHANSRNVHQSCCQRIYFSTISRLQHRFRDVSSTSILPHLMIMLGPMLKGSVYNSWKLKMSQFFHGLHTYRYVFEHVWDALDWRVRQRVPGPANVLKLAQPLKRSGTTFHRTQSTAWSTLCEGDVSHCMRQMVDTKYWLVFWKMTVPFL